MSVIDISIEKNDVSIHIEDVERPLFVNDTAINISTAISNRQIFSPIVLNAAIDLAYESARSGSTSESTSIFVRNEAILEIMSSFTDNIRAILCIPPDEHNLSDRLHKLRRKLYTTLNSKYDPEITNEIIELAKEWLSQEKGLFFGLKERLDAFPTLKLRKEALLRTEDINKDETLLMLANTLRDCPNLADEPHFVGSRLLGACARNLKGYSKTFTLMELFSLRIDEVRRYSEGKAITLGKLIAKPLEPGLAVALIESAQGLVISYVRTKDKNILWSQSIIPTHWHFQTRSIVSDLIQEVITQRAGDTRGLEHDIELIASAFAPHLPIRISIKQS